MIPHRNQFFRTVVRFNRAMKNCARLNTRLRDGLYLTGRNRRRFLYWSRIMRREKESLIKLIEQ